MSLPKHIVKQQTLKENFAIPARAGRSVFPSQGPQKPASQRVLSGDAVYKQDLQPLQQENDRNTN
jgi:hypothetical protein